jgi:hypothetical protein
MDYGTVLYCLEVFEAIQTDSRTSGWYWGEVRGKAGVARATAALCRKDLICPTVGPPPFRLTSKGEEFLRTHQTPWEAFLAHADRSAALAHFAEALAQLPDVHETRDALA